MSTALEVLTTTSLTEAVMMELEASIVRGDIAPGERISESAVAARLGVSRAPVREACSALIQAGLLIAIRNRGVFVHTISLAEALELYEVRVVIEAEMAAKLAEAASPEQIGSLERLVRQMDAEAEAANAAEYFALNLQFHQFIADNCGNSHMRQIYRGASVKLHIYRRSRLQTNSRMAASNESHSRVLAAIRDHDPDTARRTMRSHIAITKDWYSEAGVAPAEARVSENLSDRSATPPSQAIRR